MTNAQTKRNAVPRPTRQKLKTRVADLEAAAAQGILTRDQVPDLWQFLNERRSATAFNMSNLFSYIGVALVLIAGGWFMVLAGINGKAPAIVATTAIFMVTFASVGAYLWFIQKAHVGGGLFVSLAVVMVPLLVLAIMALDDHFLYAPSLTMKQELIIEGATIGAALLALIFVRFTFLTAPLFTALWCTSITLTDYILRQHALHADVHWQYSWEGYQSIHHLHLQTTLAFGAVIGFLAFVIDQATDEDFAFWGYLFGVTSFWVALTGLAVPAGDGALFGYFSLNVAFMIASVLLQRRIFLITGALGATGYVFYLAVDIFKGSDLFPAALALVGGLIIILGMVLRKHRQSIEDFIWNCIPDALVRLLPGHRTKF